MVAFQSVAFELQSLNDTAITDSCQRGRGDGLGDMAEERSDSIERQSSHTES